MQIPTHSALSTYPILWERKQIQNGIDFNGKHWPNETRSDATTHTHADNQHTDNACKDMARFAATACLTNSDSIMQTLFEFSLLISGGCLFCSCARVSQLCRHKWCIEHQMPVQQRKEWHSFPPTPIERAAHHVCVCFRYLLCAQQNADHISCARIWVCVARD